MTTTKMFKVTLTRTITFTATVEVEAKNDLQAMDRAVGKSDTIKWGCSVDDDIEATDVEEL